MPSKNYLSQNSLNERSTPDSLIKSSLKLREIFAWVILSPYICTYWQRNNQKLMNPFSVNATRGFCRNSQTQCNITLRPFCNYMHRESAAHYDVCFCLFAREYVTNSHLRRSFPPGCCAAAECTHSEQHNDVGCVIA